jgi:hypothetical protein
MFTFWKLLVNTKIGYHLGIKGLGNTKTMLIVMA